MEGLCLINEPWTTVVGGPIKLETVKDWYVVCVALHLMYACVNRMDV